MQLVNPQGFDPILQMNNIKTFLDHAEMSRFTFQAVVALIME